MISRDPESSVKEPWINVFESKMVKYTDELQNCINIDGIINEDDEGWVQLRFTQAERTY